MSKTHFIWFPFHIRYLYVCRSFSFSFSHFMTEHQIPILILINIASIAVNLKLEPSVRKWWTSAKLYEYNDRESQTVSSLSECTSKYPNLFFIYLYFLHRVICKVWNVEFRIGAMNPMKTRRQFTRGIHNYGDESEQKKI